MRRLLLFIVLLTLLLPAAAGANTRAGEPVYFPETGHTLAYSFRAFWDGNGGLAMFGYPITEVYLEEGRPVQYFERARLEWHATLPQVLAGHLGRWAARDRAGEAAFAAVAGSAGQDQDYYPETGHTLRGAFRGYWHSHGGLAIFGFPISEEFRELNQQDGREHVVQYFERARFEWHPDLPLLYQVQLGHLGRQYLEAERPAPEWALGRAQSRESAWEGLRPTRVAIPRIGLDTEIVEGGFSLGAWDVPRYTAIRYWPISAVPATQGNIVLAGHVGYRDIIFSHLPQTQLGDEVVLWVGERQRRYRVFDIMTVLPSDSWVMSPTSQETLTFITCVPIGVYSHRLIVRASPVEP
jgi:LPXTG-site transpeptidase (sortase) family protein